MILNCEHKKVWYNAVMVYFTLLSYHLPEEAWETMKTSVKTKSNLGYIQTRYLKIKSRIFHIENPTRCHSVTKFYFIFIWSSSCFGRHTAHHQEPKTVLAASGFTCVEDWWTCSCWMLSGTTWQRPAATCPTTFHACKTKRLLVQFLAPDDGQCVAQNMLSFI
jgi:hypothetical protein